MAYCPETNEFNPVFEGMFDKNSMTMPDGRPVFMEGEQIELKGVKMIVAEVHTKWLKLEPVPGQTELLESLAAADKKAEAAIREARK